MFTYLFLYFCVYIFISIFLFTYLLLYFCLYIYLSILQIEFSLLFFSIISGDIGKFTSVFSWVANHFELVASGGAIG